MSRTEKSMRNLKYGVVYQCIDVALKFGMRTAMVYTLGDAAVGLNGLFTEVLSMLSLAEMGVGTAIIYSLYQPLATGDEARVRKLMALLRRAYQWIAGGIFGAGLCVLPWVHLLVREVNFSVGYIRWVYFLYLLATSSSYLFSYKASLLTADQKTFRVTRVKIAMDVVWTGAKTASLLLFQNFSLFLALEIMNQLARNLFVCRAANREYPYLREKSDLPGSDERREIFRNIRHLFIGKLSGRITSSTDNMLISVMENTISVGLYSNYAMIVNNARTLFLQVTNATAGSIGNQMAQEPKGCYRTLKRLTMGMFFLGSVVCSCFYTQLTPLVSAWLGAERALSPAVVCVTLVNFFLYAIREPLWQLLTVSGLFKKDKNISIIGSTVNLVISILLGIPLGMLGIFIGTTATLVIQYVLKARLLFREKFGISPAGFLGMSCVYMALAALSAALSGWVCGLIRVENPWLSMLLGAMASAAIALCVGVLALAKRDEARYWFRLVARYARRLAKFSKKEEKQS